jgi:hypothetical protein
MPSFQYQALSRLAGGSVGSVGSVGRRHAISRKQRYSSRNLSERSASSYGPWRLIEPSGKLAASGRNLGIRQPDQVRPNLLLPALLLGPLQQLEQSGLIPGHQRIPVTPYPHAWIECADGRVYDPVLDEFFSAEDYTARYGARPLRRYGYAQAMHHGRAGHYGPW